jgi:hypothetical protein
MDLQWFVDKLPSGFDTETGECGDARYNDLWGSVISQLLLKKHIPDACPVATQFSWQAVHHRLFFVYSFIDPRYSISTYIYMFSYLYVFLSICFPICMFPCLYVFLSICFPIYIFSYLYVFLSNMFSYLYVFLSICFPI